MQRELEKALADLPKVTRTSLDLMAEHWALVKAWNARVNLTAIASDADAAWLHYRDSLEALAVLPAGAVVDIGSGAGFPGIPLAILEPDRPVTLVEPRRKRASFLETAVARLRLQNVTVREGRVEDEPALFAAAVTRATFSDERDIQQCLRWVERGGLLVAFRTEEDAGTGRLHRYRIRGQARALHIWEKDA